VDAYMFCKTYKETITDQIDFEDDEDEIRKKELAKYLDLPDFYQSKTERIAKISFANYENQDNFKLWNNIVLEEITINMIFI
jgi:hypothetical protein